jgi:hypothetical protein
LLGIMPGFAAASAAVVTPPSLTESSCSFMVSSANRPSVFVSVPGLSVLTPPSSQPHLKVELDPGVTLEAVVCWRSSAELGPHDDWAVSADVPLYIKEDSEGSNSRVLVLEVTDPGYRVRVTSGPAFSPEQANHARVLIDAFNRRRSGGT